MTAARACADFAKDGEAHLCALLRSCASKPGAAHLNLQGQSSCTNALCVGLATQLCELDLQGCRHVGSPPADAAPVRGTARFTALSELRVLRDGGCSNQCCNSQMPCLGAAFAAAVTQASGCSARTDQSVHQQTACSAHGRGHWRAAARQHVLRALRCHLPAARSGHAQPRRPRGHTAAPS